MEYTQRVHKHRLEHYEKGDELQGIECDGCKMEIQGQVCFCELCESYFHEACANLPLEIKHFFHPCLLYLHNSGDFKCGYCQLDYRCTFAYKCESCDFKMDRVCALETPSLTTYDEEKERILHCCHSHPLQQLSLKPHYLFTCGICSTDYSASAPTWGCVLCEFYVHKSCLDFLPEKIKPKLGSQFPSKRLGSRAASWILRADIGEGSCRDCGQSTQELVFVRAGDGADKGLCINCCLVRRLVEESSFEILKVINHFFHPCPLELTFSPHSTCNACFQNHHNFSYRCRLCNFFLAFDCALLAHEKEANQIQHFCHWHPLTLLTNIKDIISPKCNLCEGFCSESFYGCDDQCEFYIHKSCMDSLPQRTIHPILDQTIVLLHVPSAECTTCKRRYSGLTFFYCSRPRCMFCVQCILWRIENEFRDAGRFISIHHWHQLTLGEIDEARCFMCGERCSGQAYHCKECDVYFHQSCAKLPKELQHPNHPHPLTLTNRNYYGSKAAKCKFCLETLSRGFSPYNKFYQCESCCFYLDSQCVSSLPSIEYQGHPHLLSILETFYGEESCSLCGKVFPQDFPMLSCTECKFNLHLLCGPLPRIINHACHVHPLALQDYYVEDNASDEFACHICEKHRDPRERVYICAEGCLMICELKCVLPEVLASLRGELGEVELETMYPKVSCKVITIDSVRKGITCDETASGKEYVFSFDELKKWVEYSDSEFDDDETFGIEALEEEYLQNHQQNEEKTKDPTEVASKTKTGGYVKTARYVKTAAKRNKRNANITAVAPDFSEIMYSYSRDALMSFTTELDRDLDGGHKIDGDFWCQHDGSSMGGTYAMPVTLNLVSDDFFEKYTVFSPRCRLDYRQKRYIMFIVYSILDEMRKNKVVDVELETFSKWLNTSKHLQQKCGGKGLKLDFLIEHIWRIVKAHFTIQAVDIVRTKSSKLRKEQEELSALREELTRKLKETDMKLQQNKEEMGKHSIYRAAGASELKKEYYDSLEIKWRTCYEPSTDYSRKP